MNSRTALQYRKQLQSLLPKGKLWNRNEDSVLTKILYAMAEEYARIEGRAENLIKEKFLDTTTELITEHEEDFGLPEEGLDLQPTIELRRNELKSKQIEVGQQDTKYFEDICEAFGYDVIIEMFRPAWCGVFVAGDPCGDQQNIFYWKVNIDVDSVEESIEVDLTKLIIKLNKIKPGHTHILFDFYNAEFDRGFGRSFRRFPHYDNYWVNNSMDANFSNAFENNTDYYGHNFTGSFNSGFFIDYDRMSGGCFSSDEFNHTEFRHPA